MFIFRRISETDTNLEFITGNKVFDEKTSDGNLTFYVNEDIISGGEFFTYLLIEQADSDKSKVLGLLRYKFTNAEEVFDELSKCDVDQEIITSLNKELDKFDFSFVYLSRIGVIQNIQDMNIGQIISNFFEFIIKRNRKKSFIYLKVIDIHKDFIAPSYDFIAHNEDEKWGSYFIASKFLEFD